jgi:xylulokinase
MWERTRCFLEPVDWVLMRLSGRCTANVCTAFPLLLTDCRHLDALDWSSELVDLAGVERAKLPDLVPPSSILGDVLPAVAEDLGLPRGTKIVSGVNDTQAAAVATATFRRGQAAVNVGTTGQILVHLEGRKNDIGRALVSMPSPIRGRYMLMAENGIAAKALDQFLGRVIFSNDALAEHASEAPFSGVEAAVCSTAAGAGGLLFLPWLTGTVAPDANPLARGAFVNLSLETDRSYMLRAVLEGVAFSMRGLLPVVEELTETTFAELRFSGGGARSDVWAQILADVLDRVLLPLADPVHSNNRASALLAFDALGIAGVDEIDRFCPVRNRFEPQPQNRAVYDHLFAQFRATYDGLRPVFDALNAGQGYGP